MTVTKTKPAPLAPIIRQILTADPSLSADQVIQKCRSQGVTADSGKIRSTVHDVRRGLKAQSPPPSPVRSAVAPASTLPANAPVGEDGVLRNVTLIGTVLAECGGAETVRRVAEAVRTCGGVDAFLKYLDVVVGIPKSV